MVDIQRNTECYIPEGEIINFQQDFVFRLSRMSDTCPARIFRFAQFDNYFI
jgi:hypothetical protein